jgi:uncharacterized membrane protein
MGASVLLGTGAAIAFFMLLAHLRDDVNPSPASPALS